MNPCKKGSSWDSHVDGKLDIVQARSDKPAARGVL